MIRTPYYKIVPKDGNYIEFHLIDNQGRTLAIGDFTLTEWQQMARFIPPKLPSMSVAADHAVITGTGRW